ncbi:DUF418 domain-containing protein [Ilumatobacter coccineus]|uniref:Uncharacterized protein n=1 Tax=Ilumatobacter coccineus (strain NBRC 103263 / KCTC 29153 / YM16-304) TaxID=1313172 RepID=A0A6C7ECB4_ILUCY|nr:DUF418 domain-containing protein [Ilumatobacter coccineus]BAN03953.1 hypothetical protein YM304_36390 [Ilumatobacter coccineus YM16-304]
MTASTVDRASPPSESIERLPGPDVVRACALIGVVVMNYHGYLMIRGGDPGTGWAVDLFNPWTGPMATRFAATFVLMAGVGVTLLTRRAVADGSADVIRDMRWRLVRRGLVLYLLGQLLDVIWSGTIILYYGAMFVIAALLFTLATRWVVAVGVAAALAGWGINTWALQRRIDGESVSWLTDPGDDSIRRFAFDLAINGTHPLLPWLVFFCAGIVLGRLLGVEQLDLLTIGVGLVLFAGAWLIETRASTPFQSVVLSTDPFDRGIVYAASALGTALVAFGAISWLVARLGGALGPLRRAGQMTLTIYIAHILVFNLLVDWLDWIEPAGLGTALTFSVAFWVVAIAAAAEWHRRFGRGPAERVYRHLGG